MRSAPVNMRITLCITRVYPFNYLNVIHNFTVWHTSVIHRPATCDASGYTKPAPCTIHEAGFILSYCTDRYSALVTVLSARPGFPFIRSSLNTPSLY